MADSWIKVGGYNGTEAYVLASEVVSLEVDLDKGGIWVGLWGGARYKFDGTFAEIKALIPLLGEEDVKEAPEEKPARDYAPWQHPPVPAYPWTWNGPPPFYPSQVFC